MSLALVPLISLLVTVAIIGLLFFVLIVDTGRRGKQLLAVADHLTLDYQPYASISPRIRDAHFQLIESGQFRYFRHLLQGQYHNRLAVNQFDYSMVMPEGTSTQTLLLVSCELPGMRPFLISQDSWLQEDDAFDDVRHFRLIPLRPEQKPLLLRRWRIASADPQTLWPLLNPDVCDWLLAHPHLHIEWSDGILLICRPRLLLEAEQTEAAIEPASQLIIKLQAARQS